MIIISLNIFHEMNVGLLPSQPHKSLRNNDTITNLINNRFYTSYEELKSTCWKNELLLHNTYKSICKISIHGKKVKVNLYLCLTN
jgi:hypothetical protein